MADSAAGERKESESAQRMRSGSGDGVPAWESLREIETKAEIQEWNQPSGFVMAAIIGKLQLGWQLKFVGNVKRFILTENECESASRDRGFVGTSGLVSAAPMSQRRDLFDQLGRLHPVQRRKAIRSSA